MKCSCCKCQHNDLKKSGKPYKTCIKCRNKAFINWEENKEDRKLKNKIRYHKKYNNDLNFRIHELVRHAEIRAKNNNLEFNITDNYILSIYKDFCPILNIKLDLNTNGNGTEYSPTIDRIDNTKGYIIGNVAVISNKANNLKRNLTIDDLEKILNYIKQNINS